MTNQNSILDIQSEAGRTIISLSLNQDIAQDTLDNVIATLASIYPRDDIDIKECDARWITNALVPENNRTEGATHYVWMNASCDPNLIRNALTKQPQPQPELI